MIHTKKKRPNQFFFPHLGNVINEVMNTSLENIVKNAPKSYTTPSVNIRKTEDHYELEMALPGYSKKDVEIKIEKDFLIISSPKETEVEANFRLREFNFGKFERKFHLPKNVDSDKITATFKNGILSLALVIKPEAKAKSINIK